MMRRSAALALIVALTGSACGSPAAPTQIFKAGSYVLLIQNGSLISGDPPCSGLPRTASYNASLRFDVDGAGFRGRGIDENADATFDLRIQVDGGSVAGTVSGVLRDAGALFSHAPEVATLTFAPNSDGSLARFVGHVFQAGTSVAGTGSIDGRPTILLSSSPPVTGVCSPGQLRWLLSGPVS